MSNFIIKLIPAIVTALAMIWILFWYLVGLLIVIASWSAVLYGVYMVLHLLGVF